MGYQKINFTDQDVQRPKTYEFQENSDGSVTLIDSFGLVTDLGTPINADNMNHIEDGIADCGLTLYSEDKTFQTGEWALAVVDDKRIIIESLTDNNFGHEPTDEEYWQEVKLGGGGGLEIGDIGTAVYVDETKNLRRYLNGGLILQSQFVEFTNRIKQIIATQPTLACTEQEWQAEALLNVGGCVYKFVIDDNAGTIRLPKYPEYVEITADKLAVVGNGKSLGLTDGTNNFGFNTWGVDKTLIGYTGLYNQSVGTESLTGSVNNKKAVGITTDPANSGIETTGGITKLKLRYFIQVATGQETQADIINTLQLANPYTLFDCKYTEAPLYNTCWTQADGSWVSGTVQVTAYEGLAVEQNTAIAQGTTVTLPSGTSYTKRGLSVKLAGDSSITDYDFVLDTANTRFKLPIASKQRFVVETGEENGINYRVYNDGYCEQWGMANDSTSISLPKTFKDKNYGVVATWQLTKDLYEKALVLYTKTTNSILFHIGYYGNGNKAFSGYDFNWQASGYLASSEYATQNLYFYTGEIEQNANLVNIGRIEETMATKDFATSASFPSNRYVDLELGASGSSYTAPANGWFFISRTSTGTTGGTFVQLSNSTVHIGNKSGFYHSSTATSWGDKTICPCKKGDTVTAHYISASNVTETIFRFVYAEGEQ